MMHKVWSSIGEVPYCFSMSSVEFQGRTGQKIPDFDPNWVFPDCNSRLNLLMVLKWTTKFNIVKKRCPVVFQGHPSNFKVTRLKKSSILTQMGRFRTVTPVWIHQWVRNYAQSLKKHGRGALEFLKDIHQTSRSHGRKNCRFWPELSVSGL